MTQEREVSQDMHKVSNDMKTGASVIIVGGGVTGLSSAWWLAQAGVDVIVVEAGIIGSEASGRNGGGCSHYPSPLFIEEQRLWPLMNDMLGVETEYRRGRIRIAYNEQQFELYNRGAQYAIKQGFKAESISVREIQSFAPLTGDNIYGGFHLHYGGQANPHRTTQGYAWAFRRLGGTILQHTRATGFDIQGGRVVGVQTDRGLLSCDHLVLAAGPSLAKLAAMLGVDIPLALARAEMIATEPLPMMPHNGVDGNLLYGRQSLRGNLLYGGGPHEWVEPGEKGKAFRASTPIGASIARRVAEMFPKASHAKVIRTWAGLIENTPDGRPILDRLPHLENLTLCTMSGVGFGLSPAVGHAIQQLVTDGACDFADLTTLRLERFTDLEPDWRDLQGWRSAEHFRQEADLQPS